VLLVLFMGNSVDWAQKEPIILMDKQDFQKSVISREGEDRLNL
jgi:hypothetical protein